MSKNVLSSSQKARVRGFLREQFVAAGAQRVEHKDRKALAEFLTSKLDFLVTSANLRNILIEDEANRRQGETGSAILNFVTVLRKQAEKREEAEVDTSSLSEEFDLIDLDESTELRFDETVDQERTTPAAPIGLPSPTSNFVDREEMEKLKSELAMSKAQSAAAKGLAEAAIAIAKSYEDRMANMDAILRLLLRAHNSRPHTSSDREGPDV